MGIFLIPKYHLKGADEKKRYEKHKNDVEDPGYQRFVQPLVDAVKSSFSEDHSGLDFGCGKGPVISFLLEKEGYDIDLFDPYFHNDRSVFKRSYDYIILSEVIEHFKRPGNEFKILFSLLNPGGKIFCLTELFHDGIDFSSWHYKDDETHVFFFHDRTIDHISKIFGRSDHHIHGRLIIL